MAHKISFDPTNCNIPDEFYDFDPFNENPNDIPKEYLQYIDKLSHALNEQLRDFYGYLRGLGGYKWIFKSHYENIIREYKFYRSVYRKMQNRIKDTFQDNPQLKNALLKRLHETNEYPEIAQEIKSLRILDPTKLPQGPRYTCTTEDVLKNKNDSKNDSFFDQLASSFKILLMEA